jgi:Glycine zipper 2TM domain
VKTSFRFNERAIMKKIILMASALAMVVPTTGVMARKHRQAERIDANDRVWRGNNGQYYCKRNDGTTGLIVGAVGGGLAGRVIAGRGDRTVGTILGAAGGALLGRHIDRKNYRCR